MIMTIPAAVASAGMSSVILTCAPLIGDAPVLRSVSVANAPFEVIERVDQASARSALAGRTTRMLRRTGSWSDTRSGGFCAVYGRPNWP